MLCRNSSNYSFIFIALFSFFSVNICFARDNIRIVGSSTAYPFVTAIAEDFKRSNEGRLRTPIIEATGTGNGIKLFCAGVGERYPDFVDTSRPITAAELKICKHNGIVDPVEIKIGYDGIVVAHFAKAKNLKLTKYQLFLALAELTPGKDGKLINNPYKKWSDINKLLPKQQIIIYGPPATSGTRDSFVELVLWKACLELPSFNDAYPDLRQRQNACSSIRNDGHYIDAGENGNLIVQKLKNNTDSLGIVGFSFLKENQEVVKGIEIDGVFPNFENIMLHRYPISRPLFIYYKPQHLNLIPGMKEFIRQILDPWVIGEGGILEEKGLIPMPKQELQQMQIKAKAS